LRWLSIRCVDRILGGKPGDIIFDLPNVMTWVRQRIRENDVETLELLILMGWQPYLEYGLLKQHVSCGLLVLRKLPQCRRTFASSLDLSDPKLLPLLQELGLQPTRERLSGRLPPQDEWNS
jgi:hypothetical protein